MTKQQIAELRNAMGLSQTAFAMRLGVTVDMVRKYEQGKNKPSDRVLRILVALSESHRAVATV